MWVYWISVSWMWGCWLRSRYHSYCCSLSLSLSLCASLLQRGSISKIIHWLHFNALPLLTVYATCPVFSTSINSVFSSMYLIAIDRNEDEKKTNVFYKKLEREMIYRGDEMGKAIQQRLNLNRCLFSIFCGLLAIKIIPVVCMRN